MANDKQYELLMSVMHQKDFSLAEQSKVNSNLLVINQCDEEGKKEEIHNHKLWKMISTTERGLSKSRNMALKNATGEICQLCDDDEIIDENAEEIILKAYNRLPDADVIIFNINRINTNMKCYKITEIREAPQFRNYGSPMITFKLESIRKNNISFCEKFGSGSKFGGGEDSLFIRDIRKAGLKIYEYPATIATVDYARFESKWFSGYTDEYFYNQGVYHQYTKPNKIFSNILRGIRVWYRVKNKKISPFFVIKWRLAGAKGYKNGEQSFNEYTNIK